MYMNDFKMFANMKYLETVVQPIRIYCQDTGMGFEIRKCVMWIMKKRKRETTTGIEL